MLWMILRQGYLPHISPLLQITAKYVSLFTYGETLIPTTAVVARTNSISSYQGNVNPYVIDPSLVGRALLVSGNHLTGDVNDDDSLDVLDVVMYINHIIGDINLNQTQVIVADINYDINLDVLDVVALVQIIIG